MYHLYTQNIENEIIVDCTSYPTREDAMAAALDAFYSQREMVDQANKELANDLEQSMLDLIPEDEQTILERYHYTARPLYTWRVGPCRNMDCCVACNEYAMQMIEMIGA